MSLVQDYHIPCGTERTDAAASMMDEEIWSSRAFNLPVKRPRPLTPVHNDQTSEQWHDFGESNTGDKQYAYEFDPEAPADWSTASHSRDEVNTGLQNARPQMRTGCISCLKQGIPCDPENPGCKEAMSTEWNVNYDVAESHSYLEQSTSLTVFRPDTKWRRNWRERHSLNFFVNFSAPQMAGFFDSEFWQRMVIQTSYYEPAILHAITAIGALHESILQRAFADEKRKARAMEFALSQCNKSIAELMHSQAQPSGLDFQGSSQQTSNSRLAMTTCILFTSFEALQGRCNSAVNHALQGRRLLQATDKVSTCDMTRADEDDLEQMRPIVERLEVQATALLDKGRRPDIESNGRSSPMPPMEYPYSLDHAHNLLHGALNSVMRFMQAFQPTAPRDHIAVKMQEKYSQYVPWFAQWEDAFTAYLAANRDVMTSVDVKRAMVLKANHLVGTMLASVDQAAGPVAYDAYEAEFRAIVDLSREVLASFSCPPLPTLTGGSSGTPYLSFSLWVTDPLWMAISRCRNPSIRQAAFSLLSQNPRQEGIWHAGPMLSSTKFNRRADTSSHASKNISTKQPAPSKRNKVAASPSTRTKCSSRTMSAQTSNSPDASGRTSRSGRSVSKAARPLEDCETRVKDEWLDMIERVEKYNDSEVGQAPPERYKSHCQGRCNIPYLEDIRQAEL